MSLAQARADIFGKIQAEGYNVVDDPRNAAPPCILVGLPQQITRVGACLYQANLPITVIGTSPGNADSAIWMLNTTEALLSLLNANSATTGTTSVQGSNQRLPSYTLEVPVP